MRFITASNRAGSTVVKRLLAADQAEIADHPRPLALLRTVRRRRPVDAGDRGMQLVLEQEPGAVVFLDRHVVAAVETRRRQHQHFHLAQAEPLDGAQQHGSQAAAHQDGRDIEHLVGDRHLRQHEQPRQHREQQLVDVAGIEHRRALEQETVGEDGRQGAEQGADAVPVLAVRREAQRHVRPGRLIAHVVAFAPEAKDRDAVAVVDELLRPLQRARIRDVRAEEKKLSPGLRGSCGPGP
jgi:hypothetical protein